MKITIDNFKYRNVFYKNFCNTNFIFDIEDFREFVKDINDLSNDFINDQKIDIHFTSLLLDIEAQLLMSLYEDDHKFIGVSKEEGHQLIYDFIFLLIDAISWKRSIRDFTIKSL